MGISVEIVSRSLQVGMVGSSQRFWSQLWENTPLIPGFSSTYFLMTATISLPLFTLERSGTSMFWPVKHMCMWESLNPGTSTRPSQSIFSASSAASGQTSSLLPTALIHPSS